MNYRFPFKAHFQRTLGIYVGIIALVTGGYLFAIKGKSALRKYQKFNLFFSVSKVDAEPLKEEVRKYVDDETIKQIVVNNMDPELTSYYTAYSTFGLEDADVLVLEKNAILGNDVKSRFLEFDSSSLFYGESDFVYEEGHYGLLAYQERKGRLTDFVSYKEGGEYYLFVNKKSEHLLSLSSEGKTDSVFLFLKGVYGL